MESQPSKCRQKKKNGKTRPNRKVTRNLRKKFSIRNYIMDVHTKLETALQNFKAELSSVAQEFGSVSNALKNARFMSSLPFKVVAEMIADNRLNSMNMNELDAVKDILMIVEISLKV